MSDPCNDRTDAMATWQDMVAAHDAVADETAADGSYPAHRPAAAVLACSDARVPPSLLFGQPTGSLFVVRLAGNSATAGAVASLTYAVEALGTPLVVVLGHTGCGAVTAAMSPIVAAELRPILHPIDEMLASCTTCNDVDDAVTANVRHNLRRLVADRGPLGTAIAAGRVTVRGAVHDLRTGRLVDVTPHDPTDPSLTHPTSQLIRSSS